MIISSLLRFCSRELLLSQNRRAALIHLMVIQMDDAHKYGRWDFLRMLLARLAVALKPKIHGEKKDMSNTKKPISKTPYDIWIASTYAIISVLAIVAMYGLSKHGDAGAAETIASMQSPQP